MIFAVPPTAIWETSNYLWNSDGQGTLTAWTYIITSYYPIQLWWSRYSALDKLGGGVGVIFAVPPTAIWETSNYLWNSDGQGTLTAWTYNIITSYYPIQLWWSRYSALDKLGGGVGVIFAVPPTAI